MTNVGKLRFYNESESVKKEAAKLKAQGVNIIIVLSHCGYDIDQIIAAHGGPDISVIVGGHTHSFLYTGSNPPGIDTPVGEYPTVIENPGNVQKIYYNNLLSHSMFLIPNTAGFKVPIVQASALTKYVGDLTIWFDNNGKAVRWQGAPIFLGPEIQQGIAHCPSYSCKLLF